MEIRQFRYVNTVAECGSITKAAARLFISQPALSNYISKLEEELGTKLFDRTSAGRLPQRAHHLYAAPDPAGLQKAISED